MDRRLKHLGLSQAGWMTVTVLAKATQPLSQVDLANRLGVEGATMVAMIDRLEKAGLVVRKPSESDRRVKWVELTEAGDRLYGLVKAESNTFRSEFLKDIDAESLLIATELLERLHGVAESAK
ncbi:MAG: MarR family transcriptional regulator [Pseudomonadota bacterium]